MKRWLPLIGILYNNWPIPGKKHTIWVIYQTFSILLTLMALSCLLQMSCPKFMWL